MGTIILTRGTPHSSPIARNFFDTATLLNANDFRFNWSAGADIGIVRRLDKNGLINAIGFRYFGVQSLQAATSIDTVGNWRWPNGTGSHFTSILDSVYRSQLYSVELNVRRDSPYAWLTWLAGFRWLQLNDQLLNVSTNVSVNPYLMTTQNNLYGAQVGAIGTLLDNGGPFTIVCTTKAGLYGNAARNYWTNDRTRLSSDNRGQVAFVGDINLTGCYAISDHVSLRGGYQLLWLEGIAVAGDQFAVAQQQTTQTGIKSTGEAFFHGATAAIAISW